MSDKDFKVKNKLQVKGITSAGPVLSDASGNIDSTPYIATQYGGTGTSTSPNAGQLLYSSAGTTYSPTSLSSLVTPINYVADAPADPVVGQIWVESDSNATAFDQNIIRRQSFTATAGQTVFTTTVEFIDTYEQVFFNGLLLLRTTDYTTSNNNTITLTSGAAVGDIIEVVTVTNLNSTNTYTQAEIQSGYVSKSGGSTITASSASVKPIVIKAATSQTANLQEWQNSGGTVQNKIGANGNFLAIGAVTVNQSNTSQVGENYGIGAFEVKGTSFMIPRAATGIGLIVRGFASQTANLQEWQNNSGTALAYVTSSGSLRAPFLSDINGNGAFIQTNSLGAVLVNTRSTSIIGLIVRGQPSQTANLQEWQNSGGTILSAINASGGLELNGKDVEIMNIMGAY